MNLCKKFALAFAVACASTSAVAHQGHHHHDHGSDQVSLEEIPLGGLSSNQYRKLLDEAHHSIESEMAGGFVQRWRDKFQFKKSLLNAYRWYSMHRGVPHVDNAAANIAAMLLTSHSLETVGGLAMASLGVGSGLDGFTDWALTTVGITITVPGLDPLCLILVGAYNKWPEKMDRLLTAPRLFLVHGVRAANHLAGIPQGYFQGFLAEKLKTRFLKALSMPDSAIQLTAAKPDFIEFTVFGAHEGQSVTLKFKNAAGGSSALESVRFSDGASAIPRAYLSQLLAPFGFNIRNFVLEVDQALANGQLQAMQQLPYVEQVIESERTVVAKPKSLLFFRLERSELLCEGLLN